jgi:hypothetical protein
LEVRRADFETVAFLSPNAHYLPDALTWIASTVLGALTVGMDVL